MKTALPHVHAITSDTILALPDFTARAGALTSAGGIALHLRSRSASAARLTALSQALLRTETPVFVNDRADIAAGTGATGVHLPADGLPVAAVRRLVGPSAWIGRSAHSLDDVRTATRDGADYVFLGPIWETPSHPSRAPLGLGALEATGHPRVIAIGGITLRRVRDCREAGAYGVAAISALWGADDPAAVARAMLISLDG